MISYHKVTPILVACVCTLFAPAALAAYTTKALDLNPSNFFNAFTFDTEPDPTQGTVKFVDQSTAQSTGLISSNSSSVYIGVDHTTVNPPAPGRSSVRIVSKQKFNHGLFILDLAHMPGGICGTWPAFWTLGGGTWPDQGEIDIIEGIHTNIQNMMTLHTTSDCKIHNTTQSAIIQTANCDVDAPNQQQNQGCSQIDSRTYTFGSTFNSMGGGVFAMEWTSQAIKIWYFPRQLIPQDIVGGNANVSSSAGNNPDPSQWGKPTAMFAGGCDIDSHFKNHQIILDTTFCGQFAGKNWGQCQNLAPTCEQYVAENPTAFTDAFWEVRSLRVFQEGS